MVGFYGKVSTHNGKIPTYSSIQQKVDTFPPEWVDTLDRNQWILPSGINGEFGVEYALCEKALEALQKAREWPLRDEEYCFTNPETKQP